MQFGQVSRYIGTEGKKGFGLHSIHENLVLLLLGSLMILLLCCNRLYSCKVCNSNKVPGITCGQN
jgi:hypothetical protein